MAGTNSENEVVAFLGPITSYTHQAALSRFPESQYKIVPQTTIADVFDAVQSGSVTQGVVPFENSSNGSVIFTLDLFADLQNRNPDIIVCGEIYLPIHHCLLGHVSKQSNAQSETTQPTSKAKPLHDIKHITKLYSHHQAWGQCNNFLTAYFKGIERIDVSSTSKASELVSQDTTGTSAAISSRMAGDLYGLGLLGENIEDMEGNSTRFFIIRRRDNNSTDNTPISDAVAETDAEHARYKTLISFTVSHGEPGALAGCLAVFQKFKLNLTSINSRPSDEATWHYIFFVETMGRKRPDGQGAVNEALHQLEGVAQSSRWLGSWKNALKA
ncbi:prephenate dehydratase [Elasticomyces elasticus]|nr:prephenate dehydratase [Elasticomyces elasticus]KAK4975012.1 prephenate dehydratase [Elasticomyces elasticus]